MERVRHFAHVFSHFITPVIDSIFTPISATKSGSLNILLQFQIICLEESISMCAKSTLNKEQAPTHCSGKPRAILKALLEDYTR